MSYEPGVSVTSGQQSVTVSVAQPVTSCVPLRWSPRAVTELVGEFISHPDMCQTGGSQRVPVNVVGGASAGLRMDGNGACLLR